MMNSRQGNVLNASLTVMALASASRADASIYQHVGNGFCKPAHDGEYSHIRRRGTFVDARKCSEACDGVPGENNYYRGFSLVKRSKKGCKYRKGTCVCFYDCRHLPKISAELKEHGWKLHHPERCFASSTGEVSTWDGTRHIGCFKVLVAEKVISKEDTPEVAVVWGGRDVNN